MLSSLTLEGCALCAAWHASNKEVHKKESALKLKKKMLDKLRSDMGVAADFYLDQKKGRHNSVKSDDIEGSESEPISLFTDSKNEE